LQTIKVFGLSAIHRCLLDLLESFLEDGPDETLLSNFTIPKQILLTFMERLGNNKFNLEIKDCLSE